MKVNISHKGDCQVKKGLGIGVYDVYGHGVKIGTVRKVYKYGYDYWKVDGDKQLHPTRLDAVLAVIDAHNMQEA